MKCLNLLATTTITFLITGATINAAPFNSPYVGTNLGYGVVEFDASSRQGRIDSISASGISGGLFGGYGGHTGRFYMGGEVEVSWSKAVHETILDGVGTLLDLGQGITWSLSSRVGTILKHNTLAYMRGAWAWMRFSGKDVNGPRVGGGLETVVTQRLTLRTDYTYTDYKSKTVNEVEYNPREHLFCIGLALNF